VLQIEAFRQKMKEVVESSEPRDSQVVVLQVTDVTPQTIQLRGLMSARTSPCAWDLRCEVREKMITWLQEIHPDALPRLRAELGAATAPTTCANRATSTNSGVPRGDAGRLAQRYHLLLELVTRTRSRPVGYAARVPRS